MKVQNQLLFAILLFSAGMGIAGGSQLSSDEASKPRLAVLAEDVSSESRALADLLTADLSKATGVQMIERAEIDRVLAEQKLMTGGLVETASRIQLGRLLKADGLVLIRKDDARQTRVLVRMVETKSGFLAGYYQYPFTNVSMDKIVQDVSADIRSSLLKLRADPAKMQKVAIARIGNATLRDYDWLESDLPVLLAMTFSAEPGVLLMERRQLGEALNEAHLTGDQGALKTGNVLIDGEVALIYGEAAKDGSTPIVMTLRFRDAALREIGRVSREGRLTELDKIVAETVSLAHAKLRELSQQPSQGASAEPEMLLALAKRHGYIWAADAAYALNPTNTAVKNQLINQLKNEALDFIIFDMSPENILDRAKKLARADQLCQEEKSSLFSYVSQDKILADRLIVFLSQPRVMMYADLRAMLKPVRERYRREIETQQTGKKADFIKLLDCAPAFFDNPLDYLSYTRGIYEAMVRNANIVEDKRKAAIDAITRCSWPPELYLDMVESPDPVIRYFALTKLMRFYSNCAKLKQYALQAADCFDDVLKNIRWLSKLGPYRFGRYYNPDSQKLFHATVQAMIDGYPELEPKLQNKLCVKINELLNSKDYAIVLYIEPMRYISRLSITNALPLVDRILAEKDAFPRSEMILKATEWRMKKSETFPIPPSTNEPVKTLTLLSSESPEWCQSAGRLAPHPASERNLMVIIPQRFFIDGDTLWIALGGRRVPNEPDMHAAGLMKLDLTTGRVLSCCYGKVKGDDDIAGVIFAPTFVISNGVMLPYNRNRNDTYYENIISIFKWLNYIVVAQSGVGVFLYPLLSDHIVTDLAGATLINNDTGLPSAWLASIAALEDKLFIMSKPLIHVDGINKKWFLSEWQQKTKKLKLIADSEKQIGSTELSGMGIFRGEELIPNPTNSSLKYDQSVGKWQMVNTNTLTIYFVPDKKINKITIVSRSPVPKDYEPTYNVQAYKNGTLAITGYGEHWKLVFFHRAGDETAARWAQSNPSRDSDTAVTLKNKISESLIAAARAGDIPGLQQLLAQGGNINFQNEDGLAPLSRAIGNYQSETALWLIRQGADITLVDRFGGTPLFWACLRDLPNVATELLTRNANPNDCNNDKETPLMGAANNGNLDLVKQLIGKGARTTSMDKFGRTAFILSANASNPDVLIYFLQTVSDKQSLNKALFRAVISSQTNNIALLLKHGADINTTDSNAKNETGSPLLSLAAQYSEPETIQFLIDHGTKVNVPCNDGSSALMQAAVYNRADNVRVLFRVGEDIMYVDPRRGYPAVFEYSTIDIVHGKEMHYASPPEARSVLLEALGQYLLRTGE